MTEASRVRTPEAKLATVVIGGALIIMSGIALGMVEFRLGYLVATALTVGMVVFAARMFRGATESSEPREWWQLTASAVSSWILAGLFLFQALSTAIGLVTATGPAVVWIGVVVGLLVAAAYLHSAVRLSAQGGTAPA